MKSAIKVPRICPLLHPLIPNSTWSSSKEIREIQFLMQLRRDSDGKNWIDPIHYQDQNIFHISMKVWSTLDGTYFVLSYGSKILNLRIKYAGQWHSGEMITKIQMRSVILASLAWATLIGAIELMLGALFYPSPAQGCDVPPFPGSFSAEHLSQVAVWTVIYFGVGLALFGTSYFFRSRKIEASLFVTASLGLTLILIDHDYPNCNTIAPAMVIAHGLVVYFLPTALIFSWRGRRSTPTS